MIVFRLDSSRLAGSGHLMRCLTLAEELRERGTQSVFVCRKNEGEFTALAHAAKHRVIDLPAGNPSAENWLGVPEEQDAEQTAAALSTLGSRPRAIIVDHYFLGRQWHRKLRESTSRIAVIDDLANRPFDCDLLLNQNYTRGPDPRYSALLPEHCIPLLGPHYALLRPEFAETRARGLQKRSAPERVFVSYGGVDEPNMTLRTVHVLLKPEFESLQVDVVLGIAAPHRGSIVEALKGQARIRIAPQEAKMSTLMASADLAFAAAGGTTWERCCMGLPSIAVSIADNQTPTAKAMGEDRIFHYLGEVADVTEDHLTNALRHRLVHWTETLDLGRRGMSLVDGHGAARVAQALLGGTGS